jgi:DNA-binding XRE family transcriptional regulator
MTIATAREIIKDLVGRTSQRQTSFSLAANRAPKTAHHRETVAFRRTVELLGARLREIRQNRRWTVEDASERYGVEPAHVRRIEAGRTNPSLATLLSIADALSMELADLFERPARSKK